MNRNYKTNLFQYLTPKKENFYESMEIFKEQN